MVSIYCLAPILHAHLLSSMDLGPELVVVPVSSHSALFTAMISSGATYNFVSQKLFQEIETTSNHQL